MAHSRRQDALNESAVLGEAVINAGRKLGFSGDEVGNIIGRSRTTITRNGVDPHSKSGEIALMVVRVYRSLYALIGRDETHLREWMRSPIRSLQAVPADMMQRIDGLVTLTRYLDAMRGRV
jgi:hypothetical protein